MSIAPSLILAPETTGHRLEYFPVALFSSVMGTTGLALIWLKAHIIFGLPVVIGEGLRAGASLLFVALLSLYSLKALRHPQAVLQDMNHPVRVNFFAAISISFLLTAAAYMDVVPHIALGLWAIGATLHLGLALAILSSWIYRTHSIQQVNPAWFLPVVGNIIVPIAGVRLASPELSWFFFSVGLVFCTVLLILILYRLFFHEPLPDRLTPTLIILIGPPSVGFIAWLQLSQTLDSLARILYYTALFLGLLLASNIRRFLQTPFSIAAWACSFPMAALTLATLIMSTHQPSPFFTLLGFVFLIITSLVAAILVVKTLIAANRRQICLPE